MVRRLSGRIVIATHNKGKLAEFRDLLAPYGLEVTSAGELGLDEPEETGATFEENARIKAVAACEATGLPALSDDSGLCVDALGGKYITAEDVNTSVADLEILRRATKYVTGLEPKDGGSGNPSPYTAYGVYLGVRATHRLTHCAWFTSEEGLNAHTDHEITTSCIGSRPITLWPVVFAPLIELELAYHRHRRP